MNLLRAKVCLFKILKYLRYCYFKNFKKKKKKNNEQTRNTNEEINFCKVFCSMSLVKHPAIKKRKMV